MTIWLWIIGIIAVAWPTIVALYLDSQLTKHINSVAKRSENDNFAELRANGSRKEIEKLQDALEKQDALVAALWQKVLGFESNEDYSGSVTPEYLGVRPEWSPFEREWAGPVVYLTRNAPYPWGRHAKPLFFPE